MKNHVLATVATSALLLSLTGGANAALLPITAATFSPNTSPVVTATLVDFTNSSGTQSPAQGASSVSNASTTDTSTAGFRNFWPNGGTETDGAVATLGLDIGIGAINLVAADYQFGGLIGDGDNTNGNDIVLFEVGGINGGNDNTIVPLDADGNVVGDFSLTLAQSDWGTVSQQISILIDNSNGTVGGPFGGDINALGFDLSDFTGTGTLSGVTGFRITTTTASNEGLDLGFAATSAVTTSTIPEPASLALLGVGALLIVSRRK